VDGKLYAKDSEYQTWAVAYGVGPKTNALEDAKDDNSVRCPQFVSPSLRVNTVNDWYPVSTGC